MAVTASSHDSTQLSHATTKELTCKLWIHDDSFSEADVLFNRQAFGEEIFPVGTLLELGTPFLRNKTRQQSQDDASDLLFQEPQTKRDVKEAGLGSRSTHGDKSKGPHHYLFFVHDIRQEIITKNPTLQLSISSGIASLFGLERNSAVRVKSVDQNAHTATHVELAFKDVYLTRADMRRVVTTSIKDRILHIGQQITYLGSVRMSIKGIYRNGRRLPCAFFSTTTKPIFRSESSRFIIYIQMSREMWDVCPGGSGDIAFDKVTSGVLPELFRRWSSINARHLVSIVFFTRVEDAEQVDQTMPPQRSTRSRDFFRVVVGERSSGEWSHILKQLKADFQTFLHDILTFRESFQSNASPSVGQDSAIEDGNFNGISGQPTSAMNGNVLEAINTASSPFSRDFVDTDLVRTGLAILLITPGSGVFEVDEKMLRLTTENLVNNAINIDLICLSPPPLHAAPLFRYKAGLHGEPRGGSTTAIQTPEDMRKPIYASTPPLLHSALVKAASPGELDASRVQDLNVVDPYISIIPQWMHIHFWYDEPVRSRLPRSTSVRANHTLARRRTCQMHDVGVGGIMESDTVYISMPTLKAEKVLDHLSCETSDKHTAPEEAEMVRSRETTYQDDLTGKYTEEFMDAYDYDTFAKRDPSASALRKELSRRSSISSVMARRSVQKEARASRSGSSTLTNSPVKASGLISCYARHKQNDAVNIQMASSVRRHQIGERPSVPTPALGTKLSFQAGPTSIGSYTSTSQGLLIGKATASVSQSSAQASNKSPIVEASAAAPIHGHSSRRSTAISSSDQSASKTSNLTPEPSAPQLATGSTAPLEIPKRGTHSKMQHERSTNLQGAHHEAPPDEEFGADGENEKPSMTSSTGKVPDAFSSGLPLSLARWLIVVNPLKPEETHTVDHGWMQAFTHRRQALTLDMKWRSLCSPAALPLASDYLIRRKMIPYYEERTHRVSLDDDEDTDSMTQCRIRMLGQLMAFRLAKGFQVVKGSREDDISPFNDDMLGEEGRGIFLLKGNTIHVLYASDNDIQINMYQPKKTGQDAEPEEEVYRPLIKSTLEPTYERIAVPLTVARDEHNWSTIDNYIAGHLDSFSGATGFWRARFALIPIEPMRQTRRADDTDDELRIEGLLRLTQIWQRARAMDPDLDGPRDSQDKNPLGVEFQTRDVSAVLSGGLEDSRLFHGQYVVRSTQIVTDTDLYHSDKFDLKRLSQDMQSKRGVEIKDRRWYLRLHRRAFVGLDMTSWLEKNFQDVESRETAEQLGGNLMDMGLFKHARGTHAFRDGNYFYQFMPEYQLPKSAKQDTTSPRGVATKMAETGNVPLPAETEHRTVHSPQAPGSALPAAEQPKKLRVDLTAKLQCDIDIRKKSNRRELVNLHYDRLCNPEACYHFGLAWMSTTEKLVEEAISSWATTVERYGWKLVQAPLSEACKIAKVNPFRTPTVVTFAIPPPEQEPDLSHVDSTAPVPLPTHRYHPYQRALLKRFGFVMDVEASVNYPPDIDVRYSYTFPGFEYSQYIHKSGIIMAQVDIDGRLLIVANRLANNRSNLARDVAAQREKREHDRIASANMIERPGSSMLHHPPMLGSPRSFSRKPPETTSINPEISITAEQIKESLQAFCSDRAALRAFYDEVQRRDPLLSPRLTPSMGPRQAASNRSTPLMQATIPSLELPPMSGIGQLLSGAQSSSPGTTQ